MLPRVARPRRSVLAALKPAPVGAGRLRRPHPVRLEAPRAWQRSGPCAPLAERARGQQPPAPHRLHATAAARCADGIVRWRLIDSMNLQCELVIHPANHSMVAYCFLNEMISLIIANNHN